MPPDEVTYQLGVIDAQLVRLHQVRQEFGVPLPAPTIYAGLGLLADLQVTAEMLFDVCWALEREQACVNAAVQRVFDRRRPSHKREVKDSIHLEHCLELCATDSARRVRGTNHFRERQQERLRACGRPTAAPRSAARFCGREHDLFRQLGQCYRAPRNLTANGDPTANLPCLHHENKWLSRSRMITAESSSPCILSEPRNSPLG